MSTVGHPLSDVTNFLTQFYLAKSPATTTHSGAGFLPGETPGLPQPEQILEWYTEAANYDARAELAWGMAFNIFKLSAVCQGIAARFARRQASSAQAQVYAKTWKPLGELAWELVERARGASTAKL